MRTSMKIKMGKDKGNKIKLLAKEKMNRFKTRPFEIAKNFVEFRSTYNHYHKKFAFWEATNIITVFLSMQTTHWILNYKFFPYGLQVIEYINSYGQQPGGTMLH